MKRHMLHFLCVNLITVQILQTCVFVQKRELLCPNVKFKESFLPLSLGDACELQFFFLYNGFLLSRL